MSVKILHVLDHSAPLHSGYAFRTLSILTQQRALGWHTEHLTSPKQGPGTSRKDEVDGWTFHRTPSADDTGLVAQMKLTARRLDQLIGELKPDLIHAHSPVLNALPSLWVARKHGLPVVYEMRASWEDAAVDHGTTTEGSLRYRVSRGLESLALHWADQVTTICEGLRGDIRARGIADGKITVIPNAVDVATFQFGAPADESLRSRLGLEGAVVLGFAGSFYGYEGLHLLVDAVQRYYELIDVLAYPRLPIRLTELVTPLKPLEAMAQGRMFVASDVGGHRELIRDGETGFLFKAGDAQALADSIAAVLQRRDDWPRIRTQARRFVEIERTWATSVARYRDVYGRALSAKGRHVPALT